MDRLSRVICGLGLVLAGSAFAQPGMDAIAGLAPDRRLAQAPALRSFTVDARLKQERLRGIDTPWPVGVERIAEQGPWYSPMFRPGLTGRYDLRQLHAPPSR